MGIEMARVRDTTIRTIGFLRRMAPRVRPHAGKVAGAIALLLLSTSIGLLFPQVVRRLLDAAFLAGDAGLLNRVALGLLGLFLVQAISNFGQSYLTASTSEHVIAGVRRDLFSHLVHQPPGFYEVRRVGELSSRIASDAALVQDILRFGIAEILRQGLYLLGALVLLTITNPRLTLVTLTTMPFAVGVGFFFGRRVRRASARVQDRLASAVSRAEQVFTQIRTVQSFTREDVEAQRFGGEIDEVRRGGLQRGVARATLTGAVTFAAFGAIAMVLWEGGRLVLAGALSPGTLVAFLLYAVTIGGAITSLAGFWGSLQEATGAASRIFELLDTPFALEDPANPVPLPRPVRGAVVYRDVHFRYGPDLPLVLRGIDVEIEPGEKVALVGSSGAGKSTLVSLLPRFFDVERGSVRLDGVDVRRLARKELRGVIGLVPQEPMLFAGTIRENLLYGRPDASAGEVEAAARAAHAHEFIAALPRGYDELVGERGITLSAGQRQRIAIARVLLKQPAVLILDEASSSLDAESEALVQDALDQLMQDRTTLIIAHRLSTVLRAQRILVLDGGRIVDDGVHHELLLRSDLYERLYRRQFDEAMASGVAAPTELGDA
ncbi:MAG: ATP-binding cassette domain-containing protein [Gemmatimonadetes bacterium]|nr:ATP-binding cassette domain-containing protein [Gemmatimonadota bacterium]